MKKFVAIWLLMCLTLLVGCSKTEGNEDEKSVVVQEYTTEKRLTNEGLEHTPYGWDNLYGAKEVPPIWWERNPREPQAGDMIEVNIAVAEELSDKEIWIEWKLNSKAMEPIVCKHAANLKVDGIKKLKYQGRLGPFEQADQIEYSICAGNNGIIENYLGSFSFSVLEWEKLNNITDILLYQNTILLKGLTKSLQPEMALTFVGDNAIRFGVEALLEVEKFSSLYPISLEEKSDKTMISGGNIVVEFTRNPYSLTMKDKQGKILLKDTGDNGLEVLTDGKQVKGIRLNLSIDKEDEFYGFGMKYNSLNQRNHIVKNYCVNWYLDQVNETYTPIPYYFVPEKYGLYIASTYYSQFNIAVETDHVCSIEVGTGGDINTGVDFYLFTGTNADIIDAYTKVSGKPVLPPVWAFGPWISANEWDKQSEVMEQLNKTLEYEIPTSVIVLEAWSDEETFYTFNDAKFTGGDGSYIPKLSDFEFTGRWPDPKGMMERLHSNNIKVLLWQIPVLKHSASATKQSLRDQKYAKEHEYVLKYEDGSDYRLPHGTWFGNSLLIDFTNPYATEWFLSKRQYLLEELGIDGFKTDGGEFVWGRDILAYDKTKGDELRNKYPDLYAQSFFDYSRKTVKDAITFSRAGGASMQKHPICWVGDQRSTPRAFEEAIRAVLSVSMSGVPFTAYDIAGFSGDVPSSELYMRSVAQAAFSPIMQVHSEACGDPEPSQARTPWNMAARKGSEDCLKVYKLFSNMRMNLLPYIYSEAKHSSISGEPFMRSMPYSYSNNALAKQYEFQYLFGRQLLVAPIVQVSKKKIEFYLPEGIWYDLFDNKKYTEGLYTMECEYDRLPVFVQEGGILPLNYNKEFVLGGYVGNSVEDYQNLTFRIYPGKGKYQWYDYVKDCNVTIESDGLGNIEVSGLTSPAYFEMIEENNSIYLNGAKREPIDRTKDNHTIFIYQDN